MSMPLTVSVGLSRSLHPLTQMRLGLFCPICEPAASNLTPEDARRYLRKKGFPSIKSGYLQLEQNVEVY
jgi:hypothetical protein